MVLDYNKALVIPDVHHDIPWVKRILDQETDFDGIIFLGDYFDTFKKSLPSAKNVSKFLESLKAEYGSAVTFLVGNHDLMYFAVAPKAREYKAPNSTNEAWSHPYYCSGYSRNRAEDVGKYLSDDFIFDCKLAVLNNGFLLSHAGVLPQYWTPISVDEKTDLDYFFAKCETAIENHRTDYDNALFWVGQARGGNAPVSGPLWCDWIDEFEDAIPYPQICGHTARDHDLMIGQSYCIDHRQSSYGILENGNLTIKKA